MLGGPRTRLLPPLYRTYGSLSRRSAGRRDGESDRVTTSSLLALGYCDANVKFSRRDLRSMGTASALLAPAIHGQFSGRGWQWRKLGIRMAQRHKAPRRYSQHKWPMAAAITGSVADGSIRSLDSKVGDYGVPWWTKNASATKFHYLAPPALSHPGLERCR